MNIKEFEQKVRQCIYHTNMHCVQEDSHDYVCYVGDDTMRILYRRDKIWIIKTETGTAYGDTLEECVQIIATTEGVRYFPGIVPTNQQFITTIESYVGSSDVDYRLLTRDGKTHYSASYTSEDMAICITYSAPGYRHPWFISKLHNQSGLGMTGDGDSLEEAVNDSNT